LIKAPASEPNWDGPYVKRNASLIDPWGAPYQYHQPSKEAEFEIVSLGADKTAGGKGEAQDISSAR
jgi:general secretion pathway protein G